MEALLAHASRLPYIDADQSQIATFLRKIRQQNRNDIRLFPDSDDARRANFLTEGIVTVHSRNLGYECILINVDKGSGLFGKKREIEVYLSNLSANDYCYRCSEKNLLSALLVFNEVYRSAAADHLP